MSKNVRSEAVDHLFEAIMTLKDKEEFYAFFEDVCTVKELKDIAQRLEVAEMLRAGKSYQTVSAEIGASTATISRVNRCLVYGTGGYATVLERLGDTEENK